MSARKSFNTEYESATKDNSEVPISWLQFHGYTSCAELVHVILITEVSIVRIFLSALLVPFKLNSPIAYESCIQIFEYYGYFNGISR